MRRTRPVLALLSGAMLLAQPALAASPATAAARVDPAWHDETFAIWKKMVAIPTVQGRGQIPVMAA